MAGGCDRLATVLACSDVRSECLNSGLEEARSKRCSRSVHEGPALGSDSKELGDRRHGPLVN